MYLFVLCIWLTAPSYVLQDIHPTSDVIWFCLIESQVWLVSLESNGNDKPTPCALKIVSKRQVLQEKMVESIMREKNVMESCVHPFLMNMISSFQDEDYLYFVLDLYLGGELFDVLYSKNKRGNLDNKSWRASELYKSFGPEDDKNALSRYGVAGVGVC